MNRTNNNLRMSTVRWLGRHLAIDLDLGALTVSEYTLIMKTLRAVAKKGNAMEPDIPIRLVDAKEAADILGISYSQFRALEFEGVLRIPRKMLGRKTVRYRIIDINNFIMSDDATKRENDTDETA